LIAGVETSHIIIEWVFVELLKHPKIMEKLQYELNHVVGGECVIDEDDIPQLKYLQAVVKEIFHLHPPLPLLLPHESMQDCEMGGYHILAKTCIIINGWAIHQHPSAYKSFWDFNLEMFVESGIDVKVKKFQLLPFGCG
jgi:cytochrome P450